MSKTCSRSARHSMASCLRLALIWTLWLAPLNWWTALGSEPGAPVIPSWRQGVSTWGSNPVPAASTNSAATPTDASNHSVPLLNPPASYAVPIDPNLYTNPFFTEANTTTVTAVPARTGVPASTVATPVAARQDATPAIPLAPPAESNAAASNTSSADVIDPEPHARMPSENIADLEKSSFAVDQPPLYEETKQWYQYPWLWVTKGWKNHAEFGLDGSRGNSETLAMQVGAEMKRKTDIYTLAFDVDYRLANNRGETTEDNGRYNIDYDRLLNGSPWSIFGKAGLEWDQFKAFDLRLNLNGGLGYHWIRNDDTTFVTRFGAGASREFGAPIDKWTPEAVFGIEGERQLNKYNKLKGKVDYFPAWEDFSDYRIVTDFGWEILLDEEDNLSLKFAVTDRYDSTPQGAQANDLYYSVLMLIKF